MPAQTPETPVDPAVASLEARAKQFSAEADALRATTDRAAKGLGTLASGGLTAIGIAKIADIYPLPAGENASLWALFGGFLAMAVSAAWFVARFWRANRPLALSADPMARPARRGRWRRRRRGFNAADLDKEEAAMIRWIYKDALRHAPYRRGKESLADYERHADEIERDALKTPRSTVYADRVAQVARMRAEVDKAEERAKVVVVRRRLNHVFNKPIAGVLALVFVGGLVAFGIGADRLESKRSDLVMTAKTCAEAVNQAGTKEIKLPSECSAFFP